METASTPIPPGTYPAPANARPSSGVSGPLSVRTRIYDYDGPEQHLHER